MNEQEINEEMLEEMEDLQEEKSLEDEESRMLNQMDFREAYGSESPEPEEKQNQHAFLDKAVFQSDDSVRTTFLTESELGRPLFSARFLLDLVSISEYYIEPIIKQLNLNPKIDNKLAKYFINKLQNVTSSGMSRNGFAMNLNVTKKMDATRQKIRDKPLPVGGKPK